jgi:hypothetical protein
MKRLAFVLAMLMCVVSFAQEFRGALTGQVTDPTGAVIPNAAITVTNESTGAISKTTSGGDGLYTVPFLVPGKYQVNVSLKGFSSYLHTGIEILTQQTITENIKLAIGTSTETVTVTSGAPLIDVATASTGQVITEEEINDLPSNGRNPLAFARDAYGAIPKMKHATAAATPFANSTADDFSLGGGLSSSNELLLNGVPNMQDSSRTAGFSPFMDAVNTIRVDEFNANASTGDTSGGTVDITTKGGTNQFHGSVSQFYQDSKVGTAKPYLNTAVVSNHYSQFGATLGGPVWIPKVFNGRNRLFFFFAFEGYSGSTPPTSVVNDVPTCAERGQNAPTNGSRFCTDNPVGTPDYPDFSQTLTANPSNQLYDPYSTTGTGTSSFKRALIPGNKFQNAINASGGVGIPLDPIARSMLALVPAPNVAGATDGEDNYSVLTPNPANYRSYQGRLDYNISSSNKLFGEAHRSKYLTSASDVYDTAGSGTITDLTLFGLVADDVQTFSPTLNLDTRIGMSRYSNLNSEKSAGINPSTFGFPGYIASNSTTLALPVIKFSDATANMPGISSTPGTTEIQDTIQLFAMLTKVHGRHTLKGGVDIRAQKQSSLSPGSANGTFTFGNVSTNNPVSQVNTTASGNTGNPKPANFGSAYALFAMGIPTSASQGIAIPYQYNNWYSAYFVQDDWKAAANLTVSMGIRFEHETPLNESGNRMVVGWNPATVNAITTASQAAYAASYAASPNVPDLPSSITTTGGTIYATPSNRSPYNPAPLYVSPRLGIAWAPASLHGKTVFRLGLGIYNNPFSDYSGNAGPSYGFNAASNLIQNGTITSNSFTPFTTLDDPFPTCTNCAIPANPILQPVGSGYGINQNLGMAMSFAAPVKIPYTERISVDIQQQFGHDWMFEIGYIDAHGVHLSYSNAISSTPLLPYLSRSQFLDPTTTSNLSSTGTGYGITNPFKGLGAPYTNGTGNLTAPKISAAAALQAYPQYSSVTETLIPGNSTEFGALNMRLQKRMSNGLDINVLSTYSKLLTGAQNNAGGPLNYQENSSDFPWKVNVNAVYDLPFGKGRRWVNDSRAWDAVVGGWQFSTIYGFLSGAVISWGNAVYQGNGTWKDFHNNPHQYTLGNNGFNIASIFNAVSNASTYTAQAPNAYNYRTFPQNLMRQDHENNFDMSAMKSFHFSESALLQLRVDAFNAFNRPQFTNANVSTSSGSFGNINNVATGANARQLQGGLHFLF